MKLTAEINGEAREVEIIQKDGIVSARVGDREYNLESTEVEPGLFHFKLDGRVIEVYVAPNGLVDVGGEQFEVKIADPRSLKGRNAGENSLDGTFEIKTAMPGKVVRILAEKDAEIKAGEGVIVVEAMKMQNEMKSPKDGKVREVRFKEGDTVNAGDVLAVIE